MKAQTKYFLLFATILIFIFGCKKKELSNGGTIQSKIKLYVQINHHWWAVPGCRVFLAPAVDAFPGTDTTKYPFKTTSLNDGQAVFENIFYQHYWIYATGFDSQVMQPITGNTQIIVTDTSVDGSSAVYRTLFVSE